jgi:hypothetical protein
MEQSNFTQDFTAYGEAGMMATTVYLTVVSGYLITVYLVGAKLSRPQLLTISTLFTIFAFLFSFGTLSYFNLAIVLLGERPGKYYFMVQYFPFSLFIIELAGIMAAIKFTVEIRTKGQ